MAAIPDPVERDPPVSRGKPETSFWGVFGTISGRFLEEKSRKTTRKKLEKNPENPIRYYKILFKIILK